ncbi:MAG: two-component regulator propeller domain-containing protein [Acidobacteriaceae bacterium]
MKAGAANSILSRREDPELSPLSGAGAMLRAAAAACVAGALTLLLAQWLAPSAHALDPTKAITQYMQTTWNSEAGLPENSVQAIAQTTNGFLWMGTQEGLTRFDGAHFVTYTRHSAGGLASDFIQALAADPDGSLWIGTNSGLSHYVPNDGSTADGTFTRWTTRDGLAGNNITALCMDREGGLWIGSGQGLNRLDRGRVARWKVGGGSGDPAIHAMAVDSGGTLWVGASTGLWRFEQGRFVPLKSGDGLMGDTVLSLAAAPDGSIWVGTQAHGLAQIRHGRVATVLSRNLPWNEISALLADHDGAIWIAFDRHGIARYYHGKLDFYNAARGLPSDRCSTALFEDREGSLWVGFLDAGVAQLRDGKFSVFGTAEGLSGNYDGNVLQAQDGSIWIGADNKGLDQLLPDGRVKVWNQKNGLPDQAVYSELQTRNGDLWVGYQRATIARIHGRQISIYHDAEASDDSVNALFEDRQGNLWVGFEGKGLARFDQGRFQHLSQTGRVAGIAQSTDGAIWTVWDGDGVERLQNGVSTWFTTANGLHSDQAMSLYADADGSVWVGTASGGLSHIRGDQVTTWTPDQGLPDTSIGSIIEDDFGNLWMGGDTGIFHLPKSELEGPGAPKAMLHPNLYGSADGLRSRETLYGSEPCVWKSRDGRLWFGTIAGVAVIDPAHIPVNHVVPPVWIDRITFDSHTVPLTDGIRLGPGAGNLQASFSAPSFVAPQRVHFRYRLVGFDPDWIYSGQRRTAWYTNLPPGRYTLRVQAENNDGMWNDGGASFSFVLRPPLTQTPLAYLCYVLLVVLLAWIVVAARTQALTLRQQELTRTVAERTAQLEAEKAALEATRRELHIQATHDSLTGIFNRAAMLEHLQREIARATRDRAPLGVLIADLDHFKNLNDSYGHLCGDDIIREAADRLRSAMRGYDIVGRYGGEEFLILFPGWDLHVAPNRVDDLLDAVRSKSFEVCSANIRLTCSIGVAMFRPDVDSPSVREVLGRADTALYVAKNSGRNCARFEARRDIESGIHAVTHNPAITSKN